MKYVIYANLLLLAGSSIHASEQQERLHSAIKSCKIADVIEMLEAEQQTKSKKSELLKLVHKEVAKRKQSSESLFKSAGDIFNVLKGAVCAWAGYKLFQTGRSLGNLPEQIAQKKNDEFRFGGLAISGSCALNWAKAGLALLELKPELIKGQLYVYDPKLFKEEKRKVYAQVPKVLPRIGTGLCVLGACTVAYGCKKIVAGLRKTVALEELKKAQAIDSYLQKLCTDKSI